MALKIEAMCAVEAKEKQSAAGGRHTKEALGAKMRQAHKRAPRAAEKAAAIMGVGARNVQRAKALKAADPKLAKHVRDGK